MRRRHRRRLGPGMLALLLATAVSPAWGAKRAPSHDTANPAPDGCAGTYLLGRKRLIPGGATDGADGVVLEVAGVAEGAPPLVTLRSGCATAPATVEQKRGRTLVRSDLSGCNGAGKARLRAVIDASCQTMKGRLRIRGAGGSASMRRFTARLDAGPPGPVKGRVVARHGAGSFPLPDVTVFLRDRATHQPTSGTAVTDVDGNLTLPEHPAGRYEVCASPDGFAPACATEPVDVPSSYAWRDVEVMPFGGAVHGRVLLADGSPCYHGPNPIDGGVTATVLRVDGGTPAAPANSAGQYVLAAVRDPGTYTLDATCGSVHVATPVTVSREHLDGSQALDLTVPNTPPSIGSLAAFTNGIGVRRAAPGATVDVSAEVTDADGDGLH